MRALVVAPGPDFSVQDVYDGWCKGLAECGVTVGRFALNDWLWLYTSAKVENRKTGEIRNVFSQQAGAEMAAAAIYGHLWQFQPDVIFVVSGFFMPANVLDEIRSRGVKVVMIHTECPYEDTRQLTIAPHVDVNLVNDPISAERFAELTPTWYIPHSYDPAIHYSDNRQRHVDFGWVGTAYPKRIEFFEQVDWTGIRPQLAGNWEHLTADSPLYPYVLTRDGECLLNVATADMYRSSVASVNTYRREAVEEGSHADGWAIGPREVEMAASGCWFARESRPEGDDLFPMLPVVSDPAELGDLVRWAMAHPDERSEATAKAAAAIEDRTFARHAAAVLQLLDGI